MAYSSIRAASGAHALDELNQKLTASGKKPVPTSKKGGKAPTVPPTTP